MNKEKIFDAMNSSSVRCISHDDITTVCIALSTGAISVDIGANNSIVGFRSYESVLDLCEDIRIRFNTNAFDLRSDAESRMREVITELSNEIDTMVEHHAAVYAALIKNIGEKADNADTACAEVTDEPASDENIIYDEDAETKHMSNPDKWLRRFINESIEIADEQSGISVPSLHKNYIQWMCNFADATLYTIDNYDEFVEALSRLINLPMKLHDDTKGDMKHILECARCISKSTAKVLQSLKIYIASHAKRESGSSIPVSKFIKSVKKLSGINATDDDIKTVLVSFGLYNDKTNTIDNISLHSGVINNCEKRIKDSDEMRNIYRDVDVTIRDVADMYGVSTAKAHKMIKGDKPSFTRRRVDWSEVQKYIDSNKDVTPTDIKNKFDVTNMATVYAAIKRGDITGVNVKPRKQRTK